MSHDEGATGSKYKPRFILTDENGEPPSYSRKAIQQITEQYVPVESIRFPRKEFYNIGEGQLEALLEEQSENNRVKVTPMIEMKVRYSTVPESGYVAETVKAYLGIEVPYRDAEGNKRIAVGKSRKAPQESSASIRMEYETIEDVIKQLSQEIDQLKQITGAETVLPRLTLYEVNDDWEILRETDLTAYARKFIRAMQKSD